MTDAARKVSYAYRKVPTVPTVPNRIFKDINRYLQISQINNKN